MDYYIIINILKDKLFFMSERMYSFSCKMGVDLVSLDIYEDKLIVKNNSLNQVVDFNQIKSVSFDEDNNNKLHIISENSIFSLNILETEDSLFIDAFNYVTSKINNFSVNYNDDDLTHNNYSSDLLIEIKTKIRENKNIFDLLSRETIFKKEINLNSSDIVEYSTCLVYDDCLKIDNLTFTQKIHYSFIKNVILSENNTLQFVNEKLTLELLLSNNQKILLYFNESNKNGRFQLYNLFQSKIQNTQSKYYETISNDNYYEKDRGIEKESIINNFSQDSLEDINSRGSKNNITDHLNNLNLLRNKRKVILLLMLGIIIISALSFWNGNKLPVGEDKELFFNGIKEISDIENRSDALGEVFKKNSNPSNEGLRQYCYDNMNTTNTELLKLYDLKNKVSNESYIDYIDIQINRLTNENAITSDLLLIINNQTSSNETSDFIESNTMSDYVGVINYTKLVNKYKRDSESFLRAHTDIKDKFSELGIDEDFLYESEETYINDKFM